MAPGRRPIGAMPGLAEGLGYSLAAIGNLVPSKRSPDLSDSRLTRVQELNPALLKCRLDAQ